LFQVPAIAHDLSTVSIMKTTLSCIMVVAAMSATSGDAFVIQNPHQSRHTALHMGGFLEGKGNRITVREDEDAAMWIEDPKKAKKPAAKKATTKPVAKKATTKPVAKKAGSEKKAAAPAFKFPWQK